MYKILMTWELDSDPIHLHHLRLMAHYIKLSKPDVHIGLALTQAVSAAEVAWADEVFITTRLQFKHQSEARGVLSSLSQLGWTAPDLRQGAFGSWAQLYRAFKPDLVIAESSPSAVLSAVLEDIRVIQGSNGFHVVSEVDQEEVSLFPEFQDWLWHLTGKNSTELMNKPAVMFIPKEADTKRNAMVFYVNAAEAPWESPASYSEIALLYGDSQRMGPAQHWLAELGVSSRLVAHGQSVSLNPQQLLFGAYDSYSLCLARQSSYLYMGLDPSERLAAMAKSCDRFKLSIRLGAEEDVAMVLSSMRAMPEEREHLTPLMSVQGLVNYLFI